MMNKFLHTIEVRLVSIILVLVSVVRIRIMPKVIPMLDCNV